MSYTTPVHAPIGPMPDPVTLPSPFPDRCNLDNGPWQADETGVHCLTCKQHYVIGAVLRRTLHWRHGQAADLDARAAKGGHRRAGARDASRSCS